MIAWVLAALGSGEPFATVTLETPEGARQPQVAIRDGGDGHVRQDGKPLPGDVFVAYGTRSAVHVSVSTDSGASFGPSKKVGDVGALALGLRRGPRIAYADDVVVITAIAGEKGEGRDENVLAWRSTDRGGTWTFEGRVNEVAGAAREGLHAMAVGPKNEVFCVWVDLAEGEPRICGAASPDDAGKRWSSTRVVFGDSEGICPCCSPSAAFDASGKLYVMWRGHDRESRDMVVATSDDLGRTFSKPTKLGTGTWKIEACPMDGGAIAVGGGRLRSVWRRESSIFRAEIAEPERKVGDGEQPVIAFGRDGAYVAWLERRGGPLVLLRPQEDKRIQLDEHANDPALASGLLQRSPIIVAWESGPSDAPRIVVARVDGGP